MPHDPPTGPPDHREMYNEIASLIAALAKTFTLKDADAAQAIEAGAMVLEFAQDANGNRYVSASYAGQTARIYQGAIKRDN